MINQQAIPGKINVKNLQLINGLNTTKEERFDIYPLTLGLNLYENIFSENMYGMARLSDTYSLYSNLPITKDTYVYITLKSPLTGREVSSIYKVYKVGDIRQESTKLQEYTIYFISVDAYNCQRLRITKHITGNGPSEIADIHKQFSQKTIHVDKDAMSLNLFIPHLRPKPAINLILNCLKFRGVTPDYCYWETLYSYNCRSLTNCYLTNPVYPLENSIKLNHNPIQGYTYQDIIQTTDLKVGTSFDALKGLYDGRDGSTVYTYDPLSGTGYINTYGEEPLSKAYIYSSRALDYDSFAKRQQILGSISNGYSYISAPGMLERSSGDMVDLKLRSGSSFGIVDQVRSGKKMICGIVHNIVNDDYYQHITLSDYNFA